MTNNRLRLWLALAAGLVLIGALAGTALSAKQPMTKTTRVALKANGKEAPGGNAEYAAISANGRLLAFESTANLVANDNDDEHDIYIHNRVSGKNTFVSVKSNGQPGNADCAAADISPSGRYVSFACDGELTGNDQNDRTDVYRHDRKTGKTILISLKGDETQLNGIDDASIVNGVANNGIVAWESYGAFVDTDTNTAYDVFVRNPAAGTTRRASLHDNDTELANGVGSLNPSKATKVPISANGRLVAFSSPNPATDDADYGFAVDTDVFVRNLANNSTERMSLRSNGEEADPNGNADNFTPSISADGRFVAFSANYYSSYVNADSNNDYDIYVHDRKNDKTILVSVKSNGEQPIVSGLAPAFPEISANGRYVAFDTEWDFGGGPDPDGDRDVYLRDLKNKKTKRVSKPFRGLHGFDNQIADPSNNGWVGFQSMDKLTPKADDGMDWDVFLRGPIR